MTFYFVVSGDEIKIGPGEHAIVGYADLALAWEQVVWAKKNINATWRIFQADLVNIREVEAQP